MWYIAIYKYNTVYVVKYNHVTVTVVPLWRDHCKGPIKGSPSKGETLIQGGNIQCGMYQSQAEMVRYGYGKGILGWSLKGRTTVLHVPWCVYYLGTESRRWCSYFSFLFRPVPHNTTVNGTTNTIVQLHINSRRSVFILCTIEQTAHITYNTFDIIYTPYNSHTPTHQETGPWSGYATL